MLKPITPCLQRPRQIIQFTLLLDDLCLCIAVAITLPDSGNLAQVVCGHFHSFARSVEGSAFAWGKNANGQLGIGTVSVCEVSPIKILINSQVQHVSAGGNHSCAVALMSPPNLFTFGMNANGRLASMATCSCGATGVPGNWAFMRALTRTCAYQSSCLLSATTMLSRLFAATKSRSQSRKNNVFSCGG